MQSGVISELFCKNTGRDARTLGVIPGGPIGASQGRQAHFAKFYGAGLYESKK